MLSGAARAKGRRHAVRRDRGVVHAELRDARGRSGEDADFEGTGPQGGWLIASAIRDRKICKPLPSDRNEIMGRRRLRCRFPSAKSDHPWPRHKHCKAAQKPRAVQPGRRNRPQGPASVHESRCGWPVVSQNLIEPPIRPQSDDRSSAGRRAAPGAALDRSDSPVPEPVLAKPLQQRRVLSTLVLDHPRLLLSHHIPIHAARNCGAGEATSPPSLPSACASFGPSTRRNHICKIDPPQPPSLGNASDSHDPVSGHDGVASVLPLWSRASFPQKGMTAPSGAVDDGANTVD